MTIKDEIAETISDMAEDGYNAEQIAQSIVELVATKVISVPHSWPCKQPKLSFEIRDEIYKLILEG